MLRTGATLLHLLQLQPIRDWLRGNVPYLSFVPVLQLKVIVREAVLYLSLIHI